MGRSLAQTDIPLDYRIEHHILEMLLQLVQHLGMHLRAAIEHRHHETFYGQCRIHAVLHEADRLEQFSEALQSENSGCTGIITESAAVRELTVMRPSDGEQSMIM